MHFHLPKPLHGWREFAGEVGIIVIGVLIALSAEQVVEWFHWRSEVRGAREALNAEASDNLLSAAGRAEQQDCVDRRLSEIAAIFEDHAKGRRLNIRGNIGRPVIYIGAQDAWQVEVGGQALTRMPLSEKLKYSAAFSTYADLKQTLLREQDAWLRLGMLDRPQILQEGDWQVLHQAFAEAASLNLRLRAITGDVLTNFTLGQRPGDVKPPPTIQLELKRICTPIRQ